MTDPKDSQATQDKKNARLFEWIVIAGVPLALFGLYFTASIPFAALKESLWYLAIPVALVATLIYCVVNVLRNSDSTELSKIPYIVALILFFATCWVLFHQPTPLL